MPSNQKKPQVEGGDNAADNIESKEEKCPKQRGRKKKTESKGPDNVDPPKKRRGKKAGNEVERTKESTKDAPPQTKEAETVALSSTEPDLTMFPMSQANKFIPTFGKPSKKKSNSESSVVSTEKSPDKVKDENPGEAKGEMRIDRTNSERVSGAKNGKEFDDVKVMIEKLEITKDIGHIRMEVTKENEGKDGAEDDNVVLKTTSVEEQATCESHEQVHGQGKEPTKSNDIISPMKAEKEPNSEVDCKGLQAGQKKDLPAEVQTSINADQKMDTSSTYVQEVINPQSTDGTDKVKSNSKKTETAKSKDDTGKAKNKNKKQKTDKSKGDDSIQSKSDHVATAPCPVEVSVKEPATTAVSDLATTVTGPPTGADTKIAVPSADPAPAQGAVPVPPVPDATAALAQLPTATPASIGVQDPGVGNLTGSDTGCPKADSDQVTAQPSGAAHSPGAAQCTNPGAVTINKNTISSVTTPPEGKPPGGIQAPQPGVAPRAAQGAGAAPPGGGTEQGEAGQEDVMVGSGPDLDLTDSQLEDLDMDMSLDPTQPVIKTSWNPTQSFNQSHVSKSMTGPLPPPLPKPVPPKKKLPDATQKMKSLINELTALNNIVLKAKRDMEIFKRRRQQMAQAPQPPTSQYMYGSY